MHLERSAFVVGNAWDAGTAAVLETAGNRAIGTTSAGIACSRALPDYESVLSFDEALEATRRILEKTRIMRSAMQDQIPDEQLCTLFSPVTSYEIDVQNIKKNGCLANTNRSVGQCIFG